MKKLLALLVAALLIVCASLALAEPVAIKALILPKFESGEMAGDFPGEAQYYYEGYCEGGESYDIVGCPNPLYVKDGVALCVTGMGKVNSAMTLQAILMDDRFDFSNAYIISTGCAGSAVEYGVMGDVFVITATVDFDLGHHADARDLTTDLATTWFHDESYDDASAKLLNQELCEKVFNLVKDVQIETTEKTRAFMAATFDNADWAIRDPKVLRGTTVTADNYWKGMHDHANALLMTKTYGCPDPYALTEMEDHAMAVVLDRLGMLDRIPRSVPRSAGHRPFPRGLPRLAAPDPRPLHNRRAGRLYSRKAAPDRRKASRHVPRLARLIHRDEKYRRK